jgi:Zn finger protein HypA/HybF involved in hydrogenase expression
MAGRNVSADRDKEIRFECLRCGKISPMERAETVQPKCGRCGSGTGVVGDIGQGTRAARQQRRDGRAPGSANMDIRFECLRCGEVTTTPRVVTARPQCLHCGSRDGVLVSGET